MFETEETPPAVEPLGDERCLAVIDSMARITAAADAAVLAAVAELALRRRMQGRPQGLSEEESDEYTADEVGVQLRLSRNAARDRLFLAVDLLTRRPATLAALGRGEICVQRARRISEALAHVSDDVARAVEVNALVRAPEQTSAQLSARLNRLVLRADADAARRRADAAHADRHCAIRVLGDGTAQLSVIARTELVVAAFQRLDAVARGVTRGNASSEGSTSSAVASGRSLDQARVDVLLGLVLGDADSLAAAEGVQVTLEVVAPASTLAGGDAAGELLGYGPLPAETVRELAEDATWRRCCTDEQGTVVARSTRGYRPTAAMVTLLRMRDGSCRFPTCNRRASACDQDHTVPWPLGPTSVDNLATLCRHHHRLKHRPGWSLARQPNGDLRWRTPAGKEYVSPARRLDEVVPAQLGDSACEAGPDLPPF